MATELERSSNAGRPGESFLLSSPTISLPKGGGAIRGIGEKFAANPVTGTGSMTRADRHQPRALRLRPAALAVLRLRRRQRPVRLRLEPLASRDHAQDRQGPAAVSTTPSESDVFILSGAEDLVPVLVQDADGKWVRDEDAADPRTVDGDDLPRPPLPPAHRGPVRPHRALDATPTTPATSTGARSPRTTSSPSTARTPNSRIADPADPSRIFSWLICETRDDKGNAVLYRLQGGGRRSASISARRTSATAATADDARRTANRYLKRIRYGNRAPLLDRRRAAAALPD